LQAATPFCHGVYRALREAGLSIPGDTSVCGFNDTPEASVLYPPLTSVRVFPDLIGGLLGEMVLARIANPDRPAQHQIILTQLVKRESCLPAGAARVEDLRLPHQLLGYVPCTKFLFRV